HLSRLGLEDVGVILFVYPEGWLQNVAQNVQRLQFRVELREVRAELVAGALHAMAGYTVGHLEKLLAVAVRAAVVQLLHGGGKLLKLPFLARAIEFQQLVRDRQWVLRQIAFRIGEELIQVRDYVQGSVHAPPVARVGTDIRIHARLLWRGEGQLLSL